MSDMFGYVRLAKILNRPCVCTVSSESSLGAFCVAKNAKVFHADRQDSDQTSQMGRLILVFVGLTFNKVLFFQVVEHICTLLSATELKVRPITL